MGNNYTQDWTEGLAIGIALGRRTVLVPWTPSDLRLVTMNLSLLNIFPRGEIRTCLPNVLVETKFIQTPIRILEGLTVYPGDS